MTHRLNRDLLFALLSLLVQVPLALFLGHFYDDRVFMATGYLVGSGLSPYVVHNFAGPFPVAIISGVIPRIGYPPLYPLLLGLLYRFSYAVTQNVFFYNFAIKIPVIAADIALAFIVKCILLDMQASKRKAQAAFLLILFNPFILLSTVAWGEFDALLAAISVASLFIASKGRFALSAVLLGVAVALKPIALPLAPLPLFYHSEAVTRKTRLLYAALFSATLFFLYFGLFFATGWSIPLGPGEWNAEVQMAGGMTLFSLNQGFTPQGTLPPALSVMGYIWIPALFAIYLIAWHERPSNFLDLARVAAVVLLVFFLSRTWVSEPNLNLLLPFMLIVASFDMIRFRDFHIAWAIPLLFMLPNYAFAQLFFLVSPNVMQSLTLFNNYFGVERFWAMMLIIVTWEIFAVKTAVKMGTTKARPA